MYLLKHYNKIYLSLAIITLFNARYLFLPNTTALIFGCALLLLSAIASGKKYNREYNLSQALSYGTISILAIMAILGTIFFEFYRLNSWFLALVLLIIFIKTKDIRIEAPKINIKSYHLIITLFAGLLFYLGFTSKGLMDISSIWNELPYYFLPLAYIFAALVIFVSLKKANSSFSAIAFFAVFFFLGGIIYTLGYGFDQFIHISAQKHLLEFGTLNPKTLQYAGMYGINFFLNKITGVSIEILSAFLLPALTLLIPGLISIKYKNFSLGALFILLLPVSGFIVTTPQALSAIFLLALILYPKEKKPWSLAIASFVIHPLSGILGLAFILTNNTKFKKISIAFGAIGLPLAFLALSIKQLGFTGAFDIFHIKNILTLEQFFYPLKQNFAGALDIVYFAKYIATPLVVIASVCYAIKQKKKNMASFWIFCAGAISFIITYLFIDFSYLISYERTDYAERILEISFLFLLPYLIKSSQTLVKKIKNSDRILKLFFLFFFAILLLSAFYTAYPRFDGYDDNKAKNVTIYMENAIVQINDRANGKDYLVLTDQAVSAAALKKYGFKKYYQNDQGELFYYSIPSGGALYQNFLDFVYGRVSAQTSAQKAKELAGVNKIFIALPHYWENYEKLKTELKNSSSAFMETPFITIAEIKL